MDLQAILDAGDSSTSSSDDGAGGGGVYNTRRPAHVASSSAARGAGGRRPSAGAGGVGAGSSGEMDPDLERILRVDSGSGGESDSSDLDAQERRAGGGRYPTTTSTRGRGSSSAAAASRNNNVGSSSLTTPRAGNNNSAGGFASRGDVDDRCQTPVAKSSSRSVFSMPAGAGGSSARSVRSSSAASVSADTSMTHTAEDWAVLQSILDGDDDDEEDDDGGSSSGSNNDNDVEIGLSKDWASRVSRHTGSIGTTSSVGYGRNNSSSHGAKRRDGSNADSDDDEDDLADLLGSSAANRSYRTPSSSHRRTASRSSARSYASGSGSRSLAPSTNPDVDAILRSMANEDDDDDMDMGMVTTGLNNTSIRDGYVFNFGGDNNSGKSSTPVRSLGYDMAKTTSFDRKRYRDRTVAQRSVEEKKETSSPTSGGGDTSSIEGYGGSSAVVSPTSASQAISAAYLRHARNAEQKLLRPGQKDIVSPLMVKRRMKPREMLTSRKKDEASAGAQSASGKDGESAAVKATAAAASARLPGATSSASVVESKPLSRIGKELLVNSRERKSSVGLPTALAVSSKFIAVGTQKGQVLVFDHFEVLKLRLGGSSSSSGGGGAELSPSAGSVTSIDLSHDGDALIAGYTSGLVVLWDAIRGTILKSVGDVHASPVTSVRFLPQSDSLGIVTVDAGGLVNRIIFSKAVLWGSYNVETECLLDGTAGQILATHVLSPPPPVTSAAGRGSEEVSGPHPGFKKLVLVALSSDRSTFSVAVEPQVSVLYRWARPSDEMMDVDSFFSSLTAANAKADTSASNTNEVKSRPAPAPTVFLPCISWGWSQVQGGGKGLTPILARAWGCTVQLLRASFPEIDENGPGLDDSEMPPWPAFGEYNDFQSSAPVVALEWLDSRSLVYLTVTNEFTIVDTVMMTLTERLDFSVVKLVYAEFALSRTASTSIGNSDGGSKPITVRSQSITTTFQNSIRSADGRILILCQEGLLSVSNLGIEKRVSTLEEDGEWLEALALALDHYESTIKSLEDRRRLRDGDLSRHPEFAKGQRSEEEEWIANLLMRYMHLAVENAPEPIQDDSLSLSGKGRQQSRFIDLAHGHFQMLAGVCIDFCVVTRRLDLLFGPVFECFKVTQYVSVFFDVLEPYVLNDRLDYIAPEAMTHFIEHCKAMNDLAIVERCLLHMNVAFMDFDTILSLLRSNGMYTALLHVYSRGLDDFATPLAELFEAIFNAADDCNARTYKRPDGVPQNLYERYGYKAIMYIEYCLKGKMFPQGGRIEPTDKVQNIRCEIIHLLQEKTYAPPPTVRSAAISRRTGLRRLSYPYLQLLVALDAKALLDTLSLFFDEPDVAKNENRTDTFGIDTTLSDGGLSPDCQEIATILSDIIIPENERSGVSTSALSETMHSQATRDIFLDFVAKYLLRGSITVSVPITMKILTRMSSLVMKFDSSSPNITAAQQEAQEKVLELLGALPKNSYDNKKALEVVEEAGLNRAALLIHRESLMSLLQSGASRDVITHHFCSSIDCYLRDSDRDYRALVFDYIKNDCMSSIVDCAASQQDLSGSGPTNTKDLLKAPIFGKLPELINLDPVQSTQLVTEVFIEDVDEVIASLNGEDNEIALFNFFHAIISGSLAKVDPVAGPALLANLTLSHHQKYLLLMARYHPEMMYQHLTTNDNYRVEDCLKLCQEYDIADASAYLLERMGNVSSALQLMLQTLEARLMGLKRVVRSIGSEGGSNHRRKGSHMSGSSAGSSRRGASTNIKGNMGASITTSDAYKKELEKVKQSLVVALDLCERNSGASKPRSDHGSQLWFNILDRLTNAKGFLRLHKEQSEHSAVMLTLLAELLELSMQRMVSVVPLPDLLRKITTDHSGSSLGEFKEMLATLLKTYNTELKLSKNALDVMNGDVQQMTADKRRLKLRGYRIESLDDPRVKVVDVLGGASDEQGANEASNLSRLRAKRNQRLARQGEIRGRSTLSTNPRNTVGVSQSAHFGSRQIGRLSKADNYGRLM